MSLHFILGRANAGKSSHIYDEITRLVQAEPDGPPLWLLVPEQATFQVEQSLCERMGGIMRLRVVSFQRLAHIVLNSVAGAAMVSIGELGRSMLVRKVIEEKKKELRLFGRSASQPGFAEKLVEIIRELKRYRVRPEDLERVLADSTPMQPTLRNKLADIRVVYASVQEHYAGVSLDSDDRLEWLAEHVRDYSSIQGTMMWIDGFTGFTPQEYAVIAKLLAVTDVNVALTLDPTLTRAVLGIEHPFYTPWETYSKLHQMSTQLGIDYDDKGLYVADEARGLKPNALTYLEQAYLDRSQGVFSGEPGQALAVVAAATHRAEVEAAAREITTLCRDEGYRLRDICIMVRDISLYEPLLSTVLSQHDIPIFIDKKRDVQHHPLLELIRSIQEAVLADFPYEPTLRALKTDLFPLSRDEVDLLDNFVLATGLRGNRWTEDTPLVAADPERSLELTEARNKIAPFFKRLKLALDRGPDVSGFTHALYDFLESLRVGDTLLQWARLAEANADLDTARLHTQVYEAVLKVFDELHKTLGQEAIPLAAYAKIVDSGMAAIKLGLIPPRLDQVIISELGRSRIPLVRAALILGVNEGILPSKGKGEGLFSDADRECLAKAGLELGPSSHRQLFDEDYLVYVGLTRPTAKIWLSYAMADSQGKMMLPSLVIKRVCDLFPSLKTTSLDVDPPQDPHMAIHYVCHPLSTAGYLASKLKIAQRGGEISSLWWDVYSELVRVERGRPLSRIISRGLFHRNQVQPLHKKTVERMYGPNLRASVARLERLRACPFSYFSAYGLRLRERPVHKLAAVDLGNLFHFALDRFVDRLQTERLDWAEVTREQYKSITADVVKDLAPTLQHDILSSSAKYRYMTKRLERVVERSARVLGVHASRGKFRPVGVEVSFGPEGKLPSLRVELPGGVEMQIEGRIDRVDTALSDGKVYLRIIDYKSGHSRLTPYEVYYGLKIQLLTYLAVALDHAEMLVGHLAHPAGALYFRLQDPMLKSKTPLSPAEAEAMSLKDFKASGFVVAEKDIVDLYDSGLTGWSQLVPVRVKNDGTCIGDGAWTAEQLQNMLAHVRHLYVECGQQLLNGDISIAPFRTSGDNACRFCSYRPVCQFDTELSDSRYVNLATLTPSDVWNKLRAERGEE